MLFQLLVHGKVTREAMKGHKGGIYSLALKGRNLITGSGDKTVVCWDIGTGT